MRQCEVEGCTCAAQRHHIVFRSQGGLDIELNYKDLCATHHNMSRQGPHQNREIDLKYKRELQDTYFEVFTKESYIISEIAELIGYNEDKLAKRFKAVPQIAGRYKSEDIIRALMGGKLY